MFMGYKLLLCEIHNGGQVLNLLPFLRNSLILSRCFITHRNDNILGKAVTQTNPQWQPPIETDYRRYHNYYTHRRQVLSTNMISQLLGLVFPAKGTTIPNGTARQFVPTKQLCEQDAILIAMFNSRGHESVSYCVCDPDLADLPIIFASDGFCEFTGYEKDEIEGRNCRFLQGAATPRKDVDRIRQAIRNQEPTSVNLLNYRKDGSSFFNEFFLSPLRADDKEDPKKLAYVRTSYCFVERVMVCFWDYCMVGTLLIAPQFLFSANAVYWCAMSSVKTRSRTNATKSRVRDDACIYLGGGGHRDLSFKYLSTDISRCLFCFQTEQLKMGVHKRKSRVVKRLQRTRLCGAFTRMSAVTSLLLEKTFTTSLEKHFVFRLFVWV
jgi:PAS domain S-box-containing protein